MSSGASPISGEVRAGVELASSVFWAPLLAIAPKGDGHPVLVIPGLAQGELALQPLMHFLTHSQYNARSWQQGLNVGIRHAVLRSLVAHLDKLARKSGRKVSVVGWSLGGLLGRYLALERPQLIRQVLTLASPFSGPQDRSKIESVYGLFNRNDSRTLHNDFLAFVRQPLRVPSTAIYSRSDGVVPWKHCVHATRRPLQEDVEVQSSHSGMGYHPTVLLIIADRLAQPEGEWTPLGQTNGHPIFPLWKWCAAHWLPLIKSPYPAGA